MICSRSEILHQNGTWIQIRSLRMRLEVYSNQLQNQIQYYTTESQYVPEHPSRISAEYM